MTSYAAYDAGLACLNPNCKSHGKPHPNCKCYSSAGYSDGGSVDRFCSTARPHQQDCEYYADGGDVPPPFEETSSIGHDQPPPFEKTQDVAPPPFEQTQPPKDYSSPGEQAFAGLESVAQGALSKPLAIGAETTVGGLLNKAGFTGLGSELSKEAIAGREASNPDHNVGEMVGLSISLMTGEGIPALISKGVQKAIPIGSSLLAKIGAAGLASGIENGLFQTGDVIGDTMLHGKGDDKSVVASLMAAGPDIASSFGWGALFGSAGKTAAEGLNILAAKQYGAKAKDFMAGFGWKSYEDQLAREEAAGKYSNTIRELPDYTHKPSFDAGQKAYDNFKNNVAGKVGEAVGTGIGAKMAGLPGVGAGYTLGKAVLGPLFQKGLKNKISLAGEKYVYPAAMKMISAGDHIGLFDGLNYADNINGGAQKITKGIERLFQAGSQQAVDYDRDSNSRNRDKLDEDIQNNGLEQGLFAEKHYPENGPRNYAHGGEVKKEDPIQDLESPPVLNGIDVVARHWPNQAMLLGQAKGRIHNYLSSLRPQKNPQKLPYDDDLDDSETKKNYHRAMDIALQPLSILNHVKDGSVNPQTMSHFKSLYPELHEHLSKKMTERIIKSQMEEKKPSYRLRQGLSYFLGAPLDGTMTDAALQAAQSVFAPKQSPQQAQSPTKKKRGTAPLTKLHEQYQTNDQATEARQRNS